ncbi:hypothetical protein F2Q69_00020043 [Brassica cretica]|uniref:Uncharacterized protein n=1 Tax=Brassica cretica TaxID=69181 RepID=A0A8S9QCH1_BRACR|nr:hypothetical protein F2Q69_00020043 [Brassica cretica]
MDVDTSFRVIGLVAYVQIDPLEIAFFVTPGGRWKVFRGRLPVWPDRSESRNRVFCRCGLLWPHTGFYSWPSPLMFPPVLRERSRAILPCEPVDVGCGGSESDSRPVLPALPNRGFLLPLSWAFRKTRPAERTGFAFFSDGRRRLRPTDRTGRLCLDRSARNRLLCCSRREVEGSPRSVMCLAGLFRQGSDLKNPCLPVWPDRSESRNRVFSRCGLLWACAGFYSWPSPLRFPPVLRERPRAFLVRLTFSERRRTFLSSRPVSRRSL